MNKIAERIARIPIVTTKLRNNLRIPKLSITCFDIK
jgi:hypothetical protein